MTTKVTVANPKKSGVVVRVIHEERDANGHWNAALTTFVASGNTEDYEADATKRFIIEEIES